MGGWGVKNAKGATTRSLPVVPPVIYTAHRRFEQPSLDLSPVIGNRGAIKVSASKWCVPDQLLLATNAETITVVWGSSAALSSGAIELNLHSLDWAAALTTIKSGPLAAPAATGVKSSDAKKKKKAGKGKSKKVQFLSANESTCWMIRAG